MIPAKTWMVYAALPTLTLLVAHAVAQSEERGQVATEMIGRWELIAIIERGLDVTEKSGVTNGQELLVYEFLADGTYSVTVAGRRFESGTWRTDARADPKHLDHTPTESPDDPKYVGYLSQGIYEVGGDVAKICIANDPPDVRPESFDTNSCMLFIVRRVSEE